MTLCYEKDANQIRIISDDISTLFSFPSTYVSVEIEAKLNCDNTITKVGYSVSNVLDTTNKFFIENNGTLVLKPSFFGLTEFKDGVYDFKVTISKETQWIISENCIFIDVTMSCKVGSYLKDLLEENKGYGKVEKIATNIHLLHYALVNGSNCGCNCTEMCLVFTELNKLLANNTPQNTNCGC